MGKVLVSSPSLKYKCGCAIDSLVQRYSASKTIALKKIKSSFKKRKRKRHPLAPTKSESEETLLSNTEVFRFKVKKFKHPDSPTKMEERAESEQKRLTTYMKSFSF